MFALPLALLVLAILGLSGMALLHRARLGLDPLEIVAYGVPLGWAGWSLVLLGIASLAGELTTLMVLVLTFTAGAVGFALWASTQPTSVRPAPAEAPQPVSDELPEAAPETPVARPAGSLGIVAAPAPTAGAVTWRLPGRDRIAWFARERISWRPVLVLGLFSLVWVVLWSRAVQYRDDGIFLGILYLYADFPLHFGDVASIVYGDNVPMENPRYVGDRYPYHYLSTFLAASLVRLGMLPGYALTLGSALGFIFLGLGLYALGRRVLQRTGAALLTAVVYLIGGNLAWVLTAQQVFESGSLWATLRDNAWVFTGQEKYDAEGLFYWDLVLSYPIIAQRAWTLGMPLLFLILTLLLIGLRQPSHRLRAFAAAGVVTGMTPFVNLSVLLGLALVLPFLALFAQTGPSLRRWPVRAWLIYGGISVAIGLPQILFQQGVGGSGALSHTRWLPGWIQEVSSRGDAEPFWWFWGKNLGFLVIAIGVGLWAVRRAPAFAGALLWSFAPLFLIANLVVFQPLDDDNFKLLTIWYIGGALAAAWGITQLWHRSRNVGYRALLTLLCVTALLSGILMHIGLLTNDETWQIASSSDVRLGEEIRAETLPHGVFATGQYHTNPILMVGGRSLMMGYGGQLWVHGYDISQYQRDLDAILRFEPGAEALIARYGVDYVAIGQREVEEYQANPTAYGALYPVVVAEGGYVVFAVSPEAIALAEARRAVIPDGSPVETERVTRTRERTP